MVDEFQDVNEAQFKMVKMLAGSKENVVCVGDSDQSIYSWRGGDPSFALNFKDYFLALRLFLWWIISVAPKVLLMLPIHL